MQINRPSIVDDRLKGQWKEPCGEHLRAICMKAYVVNMLDKSQISMSFRCIVVENLPHSGLNDYFCIIDGLCTKIMVSFMLVIKRFLFVTVCMFGFTSWMCALVCHCVHGRYYLMDACTCSLPLVWSCDTSTHTK